MHPFSHGFPMTNVDTRSRRSLGDQPLSPGHQTPGTSPGRARTSRGSPAKWDLSTEQKKRDGYTSYVYIYICMIYTYIYYVISMLYIDIHRYTPWFGFMEHADFTWWLTWWFKEIRTYIYIYTYICFWRNPPLNSFDANYDDHGNWGYIFRQSEFQRLDDNAERSITM